MSTSAQDKPDSRLSCQLHTACRDAAQGLATHTHVPDTQGQSFQGMRSDHEGVSLLVVAHAPLATALRDLAQHVFGPNTPVSAVDVLPGACVQDSSEPLLNQIKALDQGAGVLIMTDLIGASPCNVCASAARLAREAGIGCEVITGVNAGMILRAIGYRHLDLKALTLQVIEGAAKAVMRVD